MELCIDTASDRAGVALSRQGTVVAELTWLCRANHSVELLPAIDQLLVRAGVERPELDVVFVCRGPGSYGGLRAGLSTATGLAFALKLQILGLGRLELDAYQQTAFPGPICAVHQAGRGELGWALYQRYGEDWTELIAPRLSAPETLAAAVRAGVLFCGEIPQSLVEILREQRGPETPIVTGNAAIRRPWALAELGWRRFAKGDRDNPLYGEPIYLREPYITVSNKTSGFSASASPSA
ncbi:MAG: tRNA (adenosine(37)-N6)-threonylcarbamoyltransferase complex dimerization subunit type 1 TsaB [Dehalococcoidia bacterium]